VSLGQEVFTDLDFADDVSIMAEMSEVLILALEIMNEESSALDLEINCNKTKIQASDIIVDAPPDVTILGHKVNVVDSFIYLSSSVDASGGNDSDIHRRIELARTCMKSLDRGIWHSSISLVTKLRLYNIYILLVLLYGSDTWSVTEASRQLLDAFDQWCLRRILRAPYTAHITNVSVRSQTNQPLVSSLIQQCRLKLFGHIARAAASEDHSRALLRLPVDWRRPRGRPGQSWLRTIDSDLKPLNLGLHSALRRATDRPS